MSTFKSTFIEQKKSILIPLLQRDYVQGGRTDIIKPLLDKIQICLIGTETMSLNYIYGYDDDKNPSNYIAIDGQQRLTTLWLVHLYIYSLAGLYYPVNLSFQARPDAQSFSTSLVKNLPVLLKKHRGNVVDSIKDEQWFRSFWCEEPTINNMLRALNILDKWNIPQDISQIHFENVSFSFLNMKEKGLDDDVYIKMNGRGRPLSYFENIKSWMDEQVELIWKDANSVDEWKTSMDDKWAALFWNNRNKKQDHHEEVDDEQLRFFYSALLLYWVRHKTELKAGLPKEGEYLFFSLCDYLGITEQKASDNEYALVNEVFSFLLEGEEKVIPLFWIENIGLFNSEVFKNIKEWLDKLCYLSACIEKQKGLFPDFEVNEDTTLLYHIAFEDATYNRTLPLLYAVLNCPFSDDGSVYHWLRIIRNLVFNSTIGLDNLDSVLSFVDDLSSKCVGEKHSFKTILGELVDIKTGFGFSREQLEEESVKADFLKKTLNEPAIPDLIDLDASHLAESIMYLENKPQFQGQIRFMFKILGAPQDTLEYASNFERAGRIMELSIVRNDRQEIRTSYDDNSLFRRALMTYPPHCFGWEYGNIKWQFIQGSQWKDYISSSRTIYYDGKQLPQTEALKSLVLDILKQLEGKEISVQSISSLLQQRIDKYSDPKDLDCYWKHFVRHPGVWSYMTQKLTEDWGDNENKIYLIQRINVGPEMNLRTYSLYLDICDTGALTLKESYRSWEHNGPRIYEYEGSCFYFDKNISEGNTLAIDVYHGGETEEDYRFKIFLRRDEKKESVQQWLEREKVFFGRNLLDGYTFVEKTKDGVVSDARMIINKPLTREQCIAHLKMLLEKEWK